jgi:hypothetical protein
MHAEFLFSSQKFGAFCLFLLVREGGGGKFLLVHCSGKLSGRTADNFLDYLLEK